MKMNNHLFLNKKSVSIFLFIIVLILVITISIGQYNKIFNSHQASSSEDTIVVVATYPVDLKEESNNYEEDDEREEEISTYSFASLWEKPEEDKNNIEDVTIFLIDQILYTTSEGNFVKIRDGMTYLTSLGTRIDDELTESEIRLIRYKDSININHFVKIRDVINTDPVIIKPIFNSYKHVFYGLMPKRIYFKTDLENIVNMLLLSYEDLNTKNDVHKLSNIYEFMNGDAPSNTDNPLQKETDIIEKYISDTNKSMYKKIYYADGSKVTNEDLIWVYGFWGRRYHEKNVQEFYEILTEIKNHYAE
jgi:hypothetical protein